MPQIHLESIIGPAAEFEDARLLIEREVLDVDLTAGFVDGRWLPLDQASVIHRRFSGQRYLEISIRTNSILNPFKNCISKCNWYNYTDLLYRTMSGLPRERCTTKEMKNPIRDSFSFLTTHHKSIYRHMFSLGMLSMSTPP